MVFLSVVQIVDVFIYIEQLCEFGFGVVFISYNIVDVQVVFDCVEVFWYGCNNGLFQSQDVVYFDFIVVIIGIYCGLSVLLCG